jgi:hypothetical protein
LRSIYLVLSPNQTPARPLSLEGGPANVGTLLNRSSRDRAPPPYLLEVVHATPPNPARFALLPPIPPTLHCRLRDRTHLKERVTNYNTMLWDSPNMSRLEATAASDPAVNPQLYRHPATPNDVHNMRLRDSRYKNTDAVRWLSLPESDKKPTRNDMEKLAMSRFLVGTRDLSSMTGLRPSLHHLVQ